MLKMNASLRSIWTLVPGIIPAWEAGVPGRILESKPQESATGIVWHLSAICPIVGNMGGGWSSWVSAFPPSSESGFKLNSAFIWERWAGFYKVVRRNLPFSFAEKKKKPKEVWEPKSLQFRRQRHKRGGGGAQGQDLRHQTSDQPALSPCTLVQWLDPLGLSSSGGEHSWRP